MYKMHVYHKHLLVTYTCVHVHVHVPVHVQHVPSDSAETAESSEGVLEDMESPAIDAHTVVHVVQHLLK